MQNKEGGGNMKSISIDFENQKICIMTAGQQGTEEALGLTKEMFYPFIPEQYRDKDSFTWNFEDNTFSVNQKYQLRDGAIMTSDCFIPQFIMPMKNLEKQYEEFISIMGYEEFNMKDIADAFPDEIRKLFGLE